MRFFVDIYSSSTITEPLTESNPENRKIARSLGYVHGLFDEESYWWFIQNKKLKLYYKQGYLAGIDQKNKMTKEEIKNKKRTWLTTVVSADSENRFENRVLSKEVQEQYLQQLCDYYELDIKRALDLETQKEKAELKSKTNK